MILPINFSNNKYNYNTISRPKRYANLQPLRQDTVSFSSQKPGKKLLQELSSDEINKIIKKTIANPINYIGQGNEGKVYNIPEFNCCIKILKTAQNTPFGEWSFNITEQDVINHIIAKSKNKSVIMKKIEGEPLIYNEKSQALFNLPQSSYREFIKQLDNAHRHEMFFDNAPNNILFSEKNQTITAIDFLDSGFAIRGTFSSAYSVLYKFPENNNDIKNDLKLGGKFLNIALDEIEKPTGEIDVIDFDIDLLLDMIENSSRGKLPPQYKFLRRSVEKIFELKEKRSRGEDVTIELNGQLKYARCIIKQILL